MADMTIKEIEDHLTDLDVQHKELIEGFAKFGIKIDRTSYSTSVTIIRQLLNALPSPPQEKENA